MKRFAVAGLVAVAVLFAAKQEASANCGWYWKGNIGLNFSWDAVMGTYSQPCCPGYGCPGYGAPPLYGQYYGVAANGYGYGPQPYYQAYAAPTYYYAAPVQQQAAPAAAQQPATVQVGYYPYSYNYYGYQAPSYWYGR
jgi:hypothetical protein